MTKGTDQLVEAGLRPTRQRLAVLTAIASERRPVTAQELHARLRRRREGPGLATIYRTLGRLAEAGVLRTFPLAEGEMAYRLCEPGHHHHLICERCGAVTEIASCEVEEWATKVAKGRGFSPTSHQAEIFGVCQRCRVSSG